MVGKANGLCSALGAVWPCAMAIVVGCASGEDIGAATGGSAGTRAGGGGQAGTYAGGSAGAAAGRGGGSYGGFGGAGAGLSAGGYGGSAGFGGFGGLGGSSGAGGSAAFGGAGSAGQTVVIDSGGQPATDSPATSGCGQAGNAGVAVTDKGISLRYRNQDGGAKGNAIQFDLEVSTTIANGVAIADLEIRYYFTSEISGSLVTEMYWAGTGKESFTAAVTTTAVAIAPVPGADTYLAYTLPSATAKLLPGDTLVVKPALHKAGYSASFDQCNDYSYDGANRSFVVSSRITVFVKGDLAWGSAPQEVAIVDASTGDGSPAEAQADDAMAVPDAPSDAAVSAEAATGD